MVGEGLSVEGIFITAVTPAGPGPRLAVKDLFDTAGVLTTYGSALFADHVPEATAPAVTRLQEAGYATVGKANLHEFAWGITSDNLHFGRVPNPLAGGRIAGGSSGGCAAALAADLADAGLGTDSGGSIRIPSACCGTTGFKPTHGLVPLGGCFPLAPSFDTAGPMARDVAGCERMLEALVPGFVPDRPVAVGDLRVGVAWTAEADPLVRARGVAAAGLFGDVVAVEPPSAADSYPLFNRAAATVHAERWRAHPEGYSENVGAKVRRALLVTDAEVAVATRARELHRVQLAAVMEDLDLLVTPTMAMVAPAAAGGEAPIRRRALAFTYPFNAAGLPALALPCGPAERGLPASVQLVGAAGRDAFVLAAGRALEAAIAATS
jgi:aspartyl-tRNA(Asn)/glutamyl-tRNA(Gln) amidotransferase subunit A